MLAATLWILAAAMIGAAFFAEQVDRSREAARRAQQHAQFLVDMETTRAEVLFRFATEKLTPYGIGLEAGHALRLDNRPYSGRGGDILRLQDNAGLMNLNLPDRLTWTSFLGQVGVPASAHDAMLDALQDYVDSDGLRRLNGAEAREYAARRMPPPRNDWIATPFEVRNIVGWRDQPALWKDGRFTQLVTASGLFGVNPNFAPLEVLASIPGVTREAAARVIAARREAPITSQPQWEALSGSRYLDFVFFPGTDSVRFTHQAPGAGWVIQYSVYLTPLSPAAPWRVEYYVRTAAPPPVPDEPQPAALPARPAVPLAPAEAI